MTQIKVFIIALFFNSISVNSQNRFYFVFDDCKDRVGFHYSIQNLINEELVNSQKFINLTRENDDLINLKREDKYQKEFNSESNNHTKGKKADYIISAEIYKTVNNEDSVFEIKLKFITFDAERFPFTLKLTKSEGNNLDSCRYKVREFIKKEIIPSLIISDFAKQQEVVYNLYSPNRVLSTDFIKNIEIEDSLGKKYFDVMFLTSGIWTDKFTNTLKLVNEKDITKIDGIRVSVRKQYKKDGIVKEEIYFDKIFEIRTGDNFLVVPNYDYSRSGVFTFKIGIIMKNENQNNKKVFCYEKYMLYLGE